MFGTPAAPQDPGMSQRNDTAAGRFPGTDMPAGLLLLLVALGVPRTVLADLDVVPPESGLLYYFLALTPFVAWLAVAVVRRSRRPLGDFLVLGILYGVSLVVVHQVLWDVGPLAGEHAPAGVVDLAERFGPGWREPVQRTCTSGIAMLIGVGSGLVAAAVAVGARTWRSARAHRTADPSPR